LQQAGEIPFRAEETVISFLITVSIVIAVTIKVAIRIQRK